MKRRPLIATLTAGAALAANPLPAPTPVLTCAAAMEIAHHEIVRRGLAETYHVFALYAGVDRHTEGAAFAVIVRPHPPVDARRARSPRRMKLLIHEDGRTTLQTVTRQPRAAV
jgi:hypothetical protein